jgi:hypothetical protein
MLRSGSGVKEHSRCGKHPTPATIILGTFHFDAVLKARADMACGKRALQQNKAVPGMILCG